MTAHIRRPAIMLLVVGGSVGLFTFGRLTGDREPGPQDLARAFAPAPLDAFSDIGLIDAPLLHWRTPVVVAARVLFVGTVLSVLLRVRPKWDEWVRLGLVYLLALVSVAVPLGIAVGSLRLQGGGESALQGLGVLVTLIILPIALTLLTAIWATMAAKAVSGLDLRPVLNKPAIWVLAAVSTWFYLFTSNPIDSVDRLDPAGSAPFLLALLVVAVQSVLYGALALVSTGRLDASE